MDYKIFPKNKIQQMMLYLTLKSNLDAAMKLQMQKI